MSINKKELIAQISQNVRAPGGETLAVGVGRSDVLPANEEQKVQVQETAGVYGTVVADRANATPGDRTGVLITPTSPVLELRSRSAFGSSNHRPHESLTSIP